MAERSAVCEFKEKYGKQVTRNKEMEGGRKGREGGKQARLLSSLVLFLSLSFCWCPTSLLPTPACSYSVPCYCLGYHNRVPRAGMSQQKPASSDENKEHFWISWSRRPRWRLRFCAGSPALMFCDHRSRVSSSGSRPAPTKAPELRLQGTIFHITKPIFNFTF